MKKLLFIAALFFVFSFSASAQEDVSLPRDVAEKALRALELNPLLEAKVAEYEKQIAELKRAAQTPCTLSMEKARLDLVFWLDRYQSSGDEPTRRQTAKIIKEVKKTNRRAIAVQCGYKNENRLYEGLKTAAQLTPLLLLLIK